MAFSGRTVLDAIEHLVDWELKEYASRGHRVVEAAWKEGPEPRIHAAFGDPTKTYDIIFPNMPRVRWQSRVGQEPPRLLWLPDQPLH